ncbi:MAG: hypothetical protein GXO33_04710 [Epsilonproteobacteria bacterium]|nr:hypothetical protein [Campylobacterota bacterium]
MTVTDYKPGYDHLARYQQPLPPEKEPKAPVTIPERPQPEPLDPERLDEIETKRQERNDTIREVAVGYTAVQSVKSRFEIYMTGLTGDTYDLGGASTVEFLQTLSDIEKQNNTVKAYAAYMEGAEPA